MCKFERKNHEVHDKKSTIFRKKRVFRVFARLDSRRMPGEFPMHRRLRANMGFGGHAGKFANAHRRTGTANTTVAKGKIRTTKQSKPPLKFVWLPQPNGAGLRSAPGGRCSGHFRSPNFKLDNT